MQRKKILSLIFSFLFVLACESDGGSGPYDLTFSGSGFDLHEGNSLHVAVVDALSGDVVDRTSAVISDGSFSFSWTAALQRSRPYRIDFFADLNGNGTCEAPPDDHVWRIGIPSVKDDRVITFTHSTDFDASACSSFPRDPGPFDLIFSGTGFDPHEGNTLHVAVIESGSGSVLDRSSALVQDGAFSFTWTDVLAADEAYRVDFYADFNGSGACEAPPEDHVWRFEIPAVTGHVSVDFPHSTLFDAGACESFNVGTGPFDLTFTGTGFDPHEGNTLQVALIEARSGTVLDRVSTAVADGSFSLSWPDALDAGKVYRIDFYADFNGSGFCEAPPEDHVWRLETAPVSGDVVVDFAHSTRFDASACQSFPSDPGPFDLSFAGTGFAPHNGDVLSVVVVEAGTGALIGGDSITVSDGQFAFLWPDALEAGKDYRIDFYSDFNESGACEPPPEDHVWRIDVPAVEGDVSILYTHAADFNAAACDSFSG